ncbi:MAG: sodium/solute symporter [Acidobacteria bacterium]|nr:sodium/solute symporter [Acidobacteriota bacterium]MCI0720937.1 sodium/solute symporter [Acidobacteriota bacterium]
MTLGGYIFAMVAIGAAFYRKESSLSEYFVASRQIPTIVVVLGTSAALLSGISYLGIPSYAYRVNLIPFATVLGMPIALLILSHILLPFFFKLEVVTVYEYLERRFDPSIRLLSSILFLLTRMAWLALLTYGPALVLKVATPVPIPSWALKTTELLGLDPQIAIWVLVVGISCTFYTVLGGMRAVMWTDVAQFLLLFGGLVVALGYAISQVDGGAVQAWQIAHQAGRTRIFDFSFSWTNGTFWAAMIGGVFLWLGDMGTDQLTVQRYLSAKSLRHSQQGVFFQMLLQPPVLFLLYGVGLALFAYYQQHPDLTVQNIVNKSPDALLPLFYLQHMIPGLTGLMLAAILAATMSSLTAGINSLSAATVVDLYRRHLAPASSPEQSVKIGRLTTVAWGLQITLLALYIDRLGQGLMEMSFTFMGLTATLSIGIFLTAIFLPQVNTRSLWIGVVAGTGMTIMAVANGFHWLWYYPIGATSLFTVAGLMGLFSERPPPHSISGLTYWTRDHPLLPLQETLEIVQKN